MQLLELTVIEAMHVCVCVLHTHTLNLQFVCVQSGKFNYVNAAILILLIRSVRAVYLPTR